MICNSRQLMHNLGSNGINPWILPDARLAGLYVRCSRASAPEASRLDGWMGSLIAEGRIRQDNDFQPGSQVPKGREIAKHLTPFLFRSDIWQGCANS
jgi:hypothetical protein